MIKLLDILNWLPVVSMSVCHRTRFITAQCEYLPRPERAASEENFSNAIHISGFFSCHCSHACFRFFILALNLSISSSEFIYFYVPSYYAPSYRGLVGFIYYFFSFSFSYNSLRGSYYCSLSYTRLCYFHLCSRLSCD